jgi:hypothetical protein
MKPVHPFAGFAGRMIVVQFLSYFTLGILFYLTGLNVVIFYERHPQELVNQLYRETTSFLVSAGPLFQLLRGLIFAFALYPFRKIILEHRFGWIFLWGLYLALAIIAPSSAAPGSIEGFVYTRLPLDFHLIYLPEIVLQTLVFSLGFVLWQKNPGKPLTITLCTAFGLILLMTGLPVIQKLLV